MTLDHSICSEDSTELASFDKPAESVSTFGQDANICSAVGDLSLLAEQMNNALFISDEMISSSGHVCKGSISEVENHDSDVRYAPESGSHETQVALPLCAISRHESLQTATNFY